MPAGVAGYVMSGQFWFAEFLALLAAFLYTGLLGYSPGQNLGDYATMRFGDWRTWSELATSFSVFSVVLNVFVTAAAYAVTAVL